MACDLGEFKFLVGRRSLLWGCHWRQQARQPHFSRAGLTGGPGSLARSIIMM
jgi:hypothetical protein